MEDKSKKAGKIFVEEIIKGQRKWTGQTIIESVVFSKKLVGLQVGMACNG